jgi:phosphatidylglycerol:prolipoprotein diacylglycerol transferase
MLYLGIVSGLVVGNAVARSSGLPSGRIYLATVLLLVPALAGARLASVVGSWSHYRERRHLIWRRSNGGLAMYGGLVAVPLSVPLLAALGVPFWAFWDVATFTMLTGMIFTRVGCLLTGCCAGRRGRVPMQVLEAGLGTVLLAVTAAVAASPAPDGMVFLVALVGYGLGRLALQPLRDQQTRFAGMPALAAASAALVLLALSLILIRLA